MRRAAEALLLLALAAVAIAAVPPRPEPRWTVDGLHPGMSRAEVVAGHGEPLWVERDSVPAWLGFGYVQGGYHFVGFEAMCRTVARLDKANERVTSVRGARLARDGAVVLQEGDSRGQAIAALGAPDACSQGPGEYVLQYKSSDVQVTLWSGGVARIQLGRDRPTARRGVFNPRGTALDIWKVETGRYGRGLVKMPLRAGEHVLEAPDGSALTVRLGPPPDCAVLSVRGTRLTQNHLVLVDAGDSLAEAQEALAGAPRVTLEIDDDLRIVSVELKGR